MNEQEIMSLITSEYSWEQIIYKIIAMEGMDPWNLDLSLLSKSFLAYIAKMRELDFKIPAKYVVIAATLLRMKSEHIEYLKSLTQRAEEELGFPLDEPIIDNGTNGEDNIEIPNLNIPVSRQPVRRIVAAELIAALRKALRTEERRRERGLRRRGQIVINEENITERIESLYRKIDSLLERLREEEIEFSKLVNKWTREEVLNTFIPLVHLDHEKKVHCRQERLFDEIYIKKASGEAAKSKTEKIHKANKTKRKINSIKGNTK
ncbi:MAG: segregation/condensation protein A [Candidatus Aenigmatarchaeota archaeon]